MCYFNGSENELQRNIFSKIVLQTYVNRTLMLTT
jgi:hypothetical protein